MKYGYSMQPMGNKGTSGLPADAQRSTQLTNPQQAHASCFGVPAVITTPYPGTTFRNTGPYAGH
jgi:hypothetical protein